MNEQEEFEFRARAEKESSQQSQPKQEQKATFGKKAVDYIKDGSYLPAAGAVGAGFLGAETGPGAIGLAALGGSAGESARQLLLRARGKESLSTADSLKKIAGQGALAAAGEGAGQGIAKGASWGLKTFGKPIASGLSKVGETLTGVPAAQFRRLAQDPKALFIPKTLGKAGEEFGAALKNEGIDVTPNTGEVNDPQLSTARKNVKSFFDKLRNGVKTNFEVPSFRGDIVEPKIGKNYNPIGYAKSGDNVKAFAVSKPSPMEAFLKESPSPTVVPKVESNQFVGNYQPNAGDILKARRATDRIIAGTPWKDKQGLRNLYNQRQELNQLFEQASGKGAQASKDYARSALAANFRKLLPETQTGKISYVKSVLAPMAMRSLGAPVVSSPLMAGLATSGGSLAGQAIKNNPAIRRAVLQSILQSMRKNENPNP